MLGRFFFRCAPSVCDFTFVPVLCTSVQSHARLLIVKVAFHFFRIILLYVQIVVVRTVERAPTSVHVGADDVGLFI